MRYRIEYLERDMITIHLDVDLYQFVPKPKQRWESSCWDDNREEYDERWYANFFRRLFLIKGVSNVFYDKYSLDIIRSDFRPWRTIISKVIKDLEISLNGGGVSQRSRFRRQKVPRAWRRSS